MASSLALPSSALDTFLVKEGTSLMASPIQVDAKVSHGEHLEPQGKPNAVSAPTSPASVSQQGNEPQSPKSSPPGVAAPQQ